MDSDETGQAKSVVNVNDVDARLALPTVSLSRRGLVGDLDWYARGGPRLSFSETCQLLGGACALTVHDVVSRLTRGLRSAPTYVDLDEPSLAETSTSLAAREWAHGNLPADVWHHSERTMLFSLLEWMLAGGRDGPFSELSLDALRVAARFHDATLHHAAVPGHGCFTVGSADLAARFGAENGLTAHEVEQVMVAITANPSTRLSVATHGPVAVVLSMGGLDEMMSRTYRVHPDNNAAISAAHPWADFLKQVREHMAVQRRQYPGSRFAYTGPLLNVIMRLSARSRR